jgi:ligand-binding sensor domain-containing protein/signal transduction histidine kinase
MKNLPALLFILVSFFAAAQRGVIHYSRENGLISNNVSDVAYDTEGFIWLATDNGIDRFDGQRFIHFQHDPNNSSSICSNTVTDIFFDDRGYIWASTLSNGLIRISVKTFRVKNYLYGPEKGSIGDHRATAYLVDSKGTLWISPHYHGLDRYDRKTGKFTNFRPTAAYPKLLPRRADLIMDMVEDNTDPDILWCATLDGLFSFDKRTAVWKHYPVKPETFFKPESFSMYENELRCIEQDGRGNMYIGTWGGGLLYFDKNQGRFSRFLFEPLLPLSGARNSISDLMWRDSRYLYVCAGPKNFLLFDIRTRQFIRYAESEQSIAAAHSIARNGTQIVVSSDESGFYVHNESLIYGTKEQIGFDMKRVAFRTGSDAFLGCGGGSPARVFYRDENGKSSVFSFAGNEPGVAFSAQTLKYVSQNKWIVVCTDRLLEFSPGKGLHELVRFDRKNGVREPKFAVPTAVFNDGDSVLWLGTKYGGLLRYDIALNRLSSFYSGKLRDGSGLVHDSWFFALLRSGRTLLIGNENGLEARDENTGRFFVPVWAKMFDRKIVRSLVLDDRNRLWVGTQGHGIYILQMPLGRLIRRITENDGLPSQEVLRLVRDSEDNVWMLNGQGVTMIDRRFRLRVLEAQNGMNDIYDIVPRGDEVYFLQNGGWVVARNGDPLPPHPDPRPYIQRVRLLEQASYVNNRHRFSYDENNIGFEFGLLDFSANAAGRISYRLKGLESGWHSGYGKDEAAYYNLPRGRYVFQVRLIHEGRPVIANYQFRVIPPFWLTWWFISLCFLLLATGTWWLLRSRIQRVKKEERLLTEFNRQINEMESKALRAQMNPHFLFNSLNSIRLFILKNQVDSASDYITKFSRLLRMILNHSRQELISVYDEIQTLKLYLEFERLRFDKGFEFDIEIDGQEVLGYHLPPMIVQPFVENAIWHGLMPRNDDRGYIGISFRIEPGLLCVTVQDNGIGREKARLYNRKASLKEGSVGLEITKDRLRTLTKRTNRLNDYVIEDLHDENGDPTGTLIKLYFETEKL